MLALVVTNFGNVMAEFAGVASSLELFGVSRYVVVPLAAAIVWLLVVQGTYSSVEKIFLVASAFYVCYIVAGMLAQPDWSAAAFATVTRPTTSASATTATSTWSSAWSARRSRPWMQFYLQASIVEKGVTVRQYRGVALGRHRRLHLRRRRRVVHHRGVRGDAPRRRAHGDSRRRRRRTGAAAAGRRVRVPAVRRRAVQRLAVRGVDPADLDGVRGLRRAGVRVGARQEVPRGAGVLLALHAAHRRRRRRAAGAAVSARRTSWCCRRSSTASCCRSS